MSECFDPWLSDLPFRPPSEMRIEKVKTKMRALWNGAISFGLVTIPVSLYPEELIDASKFKQPVEKTAGKAEMQMAKSMFSGLKPTSENLPLPWQEATMAKAPVESMRRLLRGIWGSAQFWLSVLPESTGRI